MITTEMLKEAGCEIRHHSMIYGQCAAFDARDNIAAVAGNFGKDGWKLEPNYKPVFRVKAISKGTETP